MSIGHLDCSTGVSGDKFLGALLDAGATSGRFTPHDVISLASRLVPEATVSVHPANSRGVQATRITVDSSDTAPYRHFSDIRSLIHAANLPPSVTERSLAVITRLAEAEAAVHGCDIESVHFHEVGAADTVVDIVGTVTGLDALGVEHLTVSPVATGSGTVTCAHGVLPVPAPATARLLLGFPTLPGPATGELTTPTGAALVATLADRFGLAPAMTAHAIGYGCGTRDIGSPNVCRFTLGDLAESLPLTCESISVLESNIDHLTPEAAAVTLERLLDEGLLDAWITPIVMKKGRAAFLLSGLAPTADAERMAGRIAALTGSLGVRRTDIARHVTQREIRTLDTPYGPVRVKVGAGLVRPEADDVARIARETSAPFHVIHDELVNLACEAGIDSGQETVPRAPV